MLLPYYRNDEDDENVPKKQKYIQATNQPFSQPFKCKLMYNCKCVCMHYIHL